MDSIISLSLQRLKNSELFQFMNYTVALMQKYGAETLGIAEQHKAISSLLKLFDDKLMVGAVAVLTDEIAEADSERDTLWRAIDLNVDAHLLSPIPEQVVAAQKLTKILRCYGDPRNLSYSEESSVIKSLCDDLLAEENVKLLKTVSLLEWVEILKSRNGDFEMLYIKKNGDFSRQSVPNSNDVRKGVEVAYLQMVQNINALLMLGMASPVTTAFIAELNELIESYRRTIAVRNASANM